MSQLTFLIAVHQYGSFSRAAKELFISQPSISRAIKEMEEEIGFPLLERTTRGIRFTQRGEVVYERAQVIVREFEAIDRLRYGDEGNHFQETMRIISAPYFADTLLTDTVIALKKTFPAFTFTLLQADSGDVIKTLVLDQADVGVILTCDYNEEGFLGELKKHKLQQITLFEDELCCILRADHPLAGMKDVDMSTVLRYQPILCHKNFADFTLNDYKRFGFSGKVMYMENVTSIMRYIAMTEAFSTYLGKLFYMRDNNIYNLRTLIPIDYQQHAKVRCVYKEQALSYELEQFIKMLKSICGTL